MRILYTTHIGIAANHLHIFMGTAFPVGWLWLRQERSRPVIRRFLVAKCECKTYSVKQWLEQHHVNAGHLLFYYLPWWLWPLSAGQCTMPQIQNGSGMVLGAKNEFEMLAWPPHSPDLNLIKHLWDVLDKQAQFHGGPTLQLKAFKKSATYQSPPSGV